MTQSLLPQDIEDPPKTKGLPRNEEEFVEFFMYALRAPVIVWPGWEDSFKDQWDKVLLHRLAHAKEVFAQQQCTEFEAMLYISSATLVAPPSHDWGQIYFWLFQRWKPEMAEQMDIKTDRPQLDQQQAEMLTRLRQWIFKKQRLHLKEKERSAHQEEIEPKRREVEATRPKLF